MRRPFTLSFDAEFIRRVDVAKGSVSRSRWIEDLVSEHGFLPAIPTVADQARMDAEDVSRNPPVSEEVRRGTPQGRRSPKPGVKSNGHREDCRCLNCERLLGNVS